MTKVAVTGAAGTVGEQALAALSEHDVTPITHSEHDDLGSVVCDVTEYEHLREALSGHEVVVHLAANPSPRAAWDEVKGVNVDGAYNVYEAALEEDLDRVVFASTNHVTHMANAADPADPESLVERPSVVSPDDPPRPDSYYGVSKVAGEALGAFYADRYGIEVIDLRIGWLMDESDLVETQEEDEERARYARAMWLSPGDCRDAIERAVRVPIEQTPLTVNVISANSDRYLSLTETLQGIGYRPRDDAAEVLEGF
ncbi:NAD-dependent epimerase/dehydratase family protein [Natronorarus salvus]|uniref:NAD-dependent epimerase/dehydratase family protein n=1 Tax=Natronorarus salvus TaxID=3117733 RepID=UPI002F266756